MERKAGNKQVPLTGDSVNGMPLSVITIESNSPASVHSADSFADELGDNMVDIDDANAHSEEVVSAEKAIAHMKPPVLDVIANMVAENLCDSSEIDSKEVNDDIDECASSHSPSVEHDKENSDIPSNPDVEISDKCDEGLEMALGNASTLESGIFLSKLILICQFFLYFCKFAPTNFHILRVDLLLFVIGTEGLCDVKKIL